MVRERLAAIGYSPTIAAIDGAGGLSDDAPYDRIIATCSVPAVPLTWAKQLAENGLVLVDVQPTISAGNLVLLRHTVDRLEGRFLSRWGGFMAMRHHHAANYGRPPRRGHGTAHSATSLPARPWENAVVWFLAQFAMPRDVNYGFTADHAGSVDDSGPVGAGWFVVRGRRCREPDTRGHRRRTPSPVAGGGERP